MKVSKGMLAVLAASFGIGVLDALSNQEKMDEVTGECNCPKCKVRLTVSGYGRCECAGCGHMFNVVE